jgi:hypothetical protein
MDLSGRDPVQLRVETVVRTFSRLGATISCLVKRTFSRDEREEFLGTLDPPTTLEAPSQAKRFHHAIGLGGRNGFMAPGDQAVV